MKTNRVLAAVLLLVASLGAASAARDLYWKGIRAATDQGLPQTALASLPALIRSAESAGAWSEAVRAVVLKVALEARIQGNKPEEKIRRLQAEIDRAPAPMRPTMEAILAEWYAQYLEQNRWRFASRSATAAMPDSDFTTWDLPRIEAEIDRRYRRALADPAALRAEPIARWSDLVVGGNSPDAYRPTLWDFVAFEALRFMRAGEPVASRPEQPFTLRADGPALDDAEAFMRWRPATADTASRTLAAVRLLQELIGWHLSRGDTAAAVDADLWRIDFAREVAAGTDRDARAMRAYERIAQRWRGHEISSRALHAWAELLRGRGELVAAHDVATRGIARFPGSVGSNRCFNLVRELEARELAVTTENVWADERPALAVHYRNLESVHFRLVRWDFDAKAKRREGPWRIDDDDLADLCAARPERAWAESLSGTPDYRAAVSGKHAPAGLPPGAYALLYSARADFAAADNALGAMLVWVSDLAVTSRSADHGVEGLVLDARSGEPVANATVELWDDDGNGPPKVSVRARTGADGHWYASKVGPAEFTTVSAGARRVALELQSYPRNPNPDTPGRNTLLFTDRALYRPGQTIHFKGIGFEYDREQGRYHTLAGQGATVVLRDPNGQEVARQALTGNAVGSFSGTFDAPRDRLLGAMSIAVEGTAPGSVMVRVEEYKRPKFFVTLDAPREALALGAHVELAGHATAYTSAGVDGATVRWRVVRGVRYPIWWEWCFGWRGRTRASEQEIAHGEARTDGDGRFVVPFTARPDSAAGAEDEPSFVYTVTADVTEAAGETRSAARSIVLGYTSLAASLTAPEWQVADAPVELAATTSTLDGVPRPASGTVIVYRLREPVRIERVPLGGMPWTPYPRRVADAARPNDPATWERGERVATRSFVTDSSGRTTLPLQLAAGAYRAELETRDPQGHRVTAVKPLLVADPASGRFALPLPDFFRVRTPVVEVGDTLLATWGTGYAQGRAYVEIERAQRTIAAYWTAAGATQSAIRVPVADSLRGGFGLRVTAVHENRLYVHYERISVPWSDRQLHLRWEHLVSNLVPGQRETWSAVVTGPDGSPHAAEMVATLYDASLDAYAPFGWPSGFSAFRTDYGWDDTRFGDTPAWMRAGRTTWNREVRAAELTYRRFPSGLLSGAYDGTLVPSRYVGASGSTRRPGHVRIVRYGMRAGDTWGGFPQEYRGDDAYAATDRLSMAIPMRAAVSGEVHLRGGRRDEMKMQWSGVAALTEAVNAPAAPVPASAVANAPAAAPSLDQVAARKNLQETAFFFPHLTTDANGEVRMTFTMPEAVTTWRFLGFAHDRDLRAGLLGGEAVTRRELMVQPNPPRFLRERDTLEFTVKVTNTGASAQSGRVKLTFADAASGADASAALGVASPEQSFAVPAGQSRTFAWRLVVPDDIGSLTYRAVAASASFSDGEEGVVPVVSRSVLVTESLPLPVRGAGTRTFDFERLERSAASSGIRSQTLTLQMVSNPAWYAVLALPYLMEYPFECSEQTFNRLYANELARHVANRDPAIRAMFERWKGTDALDSPLEKNDELKSVALLETPWVRQAQSESQARRNVGVLFDRARLDRECGAAYAKLEAMQLADGRWPWFPGGRGDDYLTLYVVTGFARLRHLGVGVRMDAALRAVRRLDTWSDERYRDILAHGHPEANHLTPIVAMYLYGRSFYLEDEPFAPRFRAARDYWLAQAKRYWLPLEARQSQAQLAVALQRFGDAATAQAILRSVREHAVTSEELGMFWRDEEHSWWWYRAPIETQAMLIEAFDEVAHDSLAVDACRVWLLKQKQTQDWKTTKATADAVYALLLRGGSWLRTDALVDVELGGVPVRPGHVEPGTGFFERRFVRGAIRPEMGRVTVRKHEPGVAWGSLHWQYLADVNAVTAYTGTPLTLAKSLWRRRATSSGPVIEPLAGAAHVGDEIVVRIELRVDRDMEYVHLKDGRGSGTEPVNVLSGQRYQDGLAYYEETRDTGTHFFIHDLPKGTYVFEYPVRVQHRGRYPSGPAEVQCLYAPEFNSHSASIPIVAQ